MATALFTCASDKERDDFLAILNKLTNGVIDDASAALVTKLLASVQLDPLISTTENARVYIGGQHIAEGTLAAMNARFMQEVTAHKGNVEIRVLRNGVWKTVRARTRQQI